MTFLIYELNKSAACNIYMMVNPFMHPHFPGPRCNGSIPGCGAEPRQHLQVPEQPQNHGPDQQTQLQVWRPAALKRAERVHVQFQYSAVASSL